MNEIGMAMVRVGPVRQICRVLFASGLIALAGCLGEAGLLDDDPLRGGRPIPTNATTTPSARAVSDTTAANNTPTALPLANGPTSPAALVSGAGALPAPPPASAPLPPEIGVKVGGPQPVTTRLTPVAATSNSGGSGVIQASAAAPLPVSAPAVVSSPAVTGLSYEQLQQMLLQRGVTWQQLKTGTAKGEWIFVCTIPDPSVSNIEKHYEAKVVGPYGLDAIRAVLKDIDDDVQGK